MIVCSPTGPVVRPYPLQDLAYLLQTAGAAASPAPAIPLAGGIPLYSVEAMTYHVRAIGETATETPQGPLHGWVKTRNPNLI